MKEVVVCLEHRFYEFEGALYTKLAFPYSYWSSYLEYFDKVIIFARVQPVDTLSNEMARVDGRDVFYKALPYYVGPASFFSKLPSLIASAFALAWRHDYFLLRSGNTANLVWLFLIVLRRRYIREYPGNIREGIVGFAGNRPIVRLTAGFLHRLARLQGRYSRANSYVSEYCRALYDDGRGGIIFSSFNSAEIKVQKTDFTIESNCLKIISVGRLEKEKGHQTLVDAVASFSKEIPVRVSFIGDGGHRVSLEAQCRASGVNAEFLGPITNREFIFERLRCSDIFVIPSLTEGMPRALLEALAIGVPCIGSNVGGIPEVLGKCSLFPPGDTNSLVDLLRRYSRSEEFRERLSREGVEVVESRFNPKALLKEKIRFWRALHE
jgi:glycosyltransferase involved in cell wall biosynthesis